MELTGLLKGQIALLPDKPGVYLMKDESDDIIYIGKAKNLKRRVSQYFLRPQSGKVFAMVSHVHHFDFIIVHTDKEAFILEMNLIQTHHPRYNVMLMDDSHYPYIAIRRSDAYLKISRSTTDRRYFYFGPFPNAKDAYKTIALLNRVYPTRKCRNLPKKACLYFHLGQCLAPCEREIPESEYRALYENIKRFLEGDVLLVKENLRAKMLKASAEQRYEDAARYKETIDAIMKTIAKQSVESSSDRTDRDVFAFAERDGYLGLAILSYRRGTLLGKKNKVLPSFGPGNERASELIEEYYRFNELPAEIACNIEGFDDEFLGVFPEAKIIHPKEGRLLEQIDLASLNARQGLDAHFLSARLSDDALRLLEELGELLHIKTPCRIELFDNSHLQGSDPVGAMVCYINGEPCRSMYRKFHLSEENAGDDYGAMKEVVRRRYARLKEEGREFPDLILADGGIGQVRATLEGLNSIGVDIPVYGLYKNDKHQTEGIIDEKGEISRLSPQSPLFFLLMRMQDEVHRFAISFHRSERAKSMRLSVYDGVKGIGPKRKETLRKNYPTIDALKKASLEELSQILPYESALALYKKAQSLH